MNMKCRKCNKIKVPELFSKCSKRKSGYKTTCKACDAEYAREFRKKNKNYKGSGLINKYPKEERHLMKMIRRSLRMALERIKKYGKEPSDLDADWLYELYKQQQGNCKLSGIPMSLTIGNTHVISLDQIEPGKGYIQGNVQWLSWSVNRAKGDLNTDEFIYMCRQVTEKCND